MCDVRCTAQIDYSCDRLGTNGAVHYHLSLSERGGTTSSCRAGQHRTFLRVARGIFNSVSCIQACGQKCASELLDRLGHPRGVWETVRTSEM